MDTISAITGIIAGIAAQGAVTVTIPNDTEIIREMGPVEFTRQLGPIELRVQTAPAKKTFKAAPAETTNQQTPAETTTQDTPKTPESQSAPATVESPVAAAKVESQTNPARVASRTPSPDVSSQDTLTKETGYTGLWYDHTGRSAIKISNCGEGLCGRIAWLKNSDHNSVCGTDIIGGAQKVGNVYDKGWIYDIDRGKKFDVELKLLNENKLRVKGYAGMKFLSKTFVWNRAPGNLELCS